MSRTTLTTPHANSLWPVRSPKVIGAAVLAALLVLLFVAANTAVTPHAAVAVGNVVQQSTEPIYFPGRPF